MLGKTQAGGQEMTEDEIVGWHHQLNGHEFEQAPADGGGQRSLVCYSSRGHKESDMTEWPTKETCASLTWRNTRWIFFLYFSILALLALLSLNLVVFIKHNLILINIYQILSNINIWRLAYNGKHAFQLIIFSKVYENILCRLVCFTLVTKVMI